MGARGEDIHAYLCRGQIFEDGEYVPPIDLLFRLFCEVHVPRMYPLQKA